MAFSGELFAIAAGDYRAEIAEVGAALAGLWLADRPVTVDADPEQLPPKSSGAVLVPWPNRIRDGRYAFDGEQFQLPLTEPAAGNASHGLVKWVRWSCQDRRPAELTLVHDLVPQTGYPFELRLELRYALDPVTGLAVRLTAHNTGRRDAPFGAGFHPYLDLAGHPLDTAELLVPADTVLLTDGQQIPVRAGAGGRHLLRLPGAPPDRCGPAGPRLCRPDRPARRCCGPPSGPSSCAGTPGSATCRSSPRRSSRRAATRWRSSR